MTGHELRAIGLASLCVALAAFDGSVLFLALPAVAREFGAGVGTLSGLGSLLSLGALGALPLAALADRRGRRLLLIVGVAGFSLANLASAAAPQLAVLSALRFVAVAFEGMTGAVATALVVEAVSSRRRGVAMAVLALGGGAGAGVTALAYPFLAPSWRPLYAAGGAGLLAVPALWRWLPEAPAWISAPPRTVRSLLADPEWMRRVGILSVSAGLTGLVVAPATLFAALYASRHLGLRPDAISAVVIASGLCAGAGFAAGGPLSDRSGRRIPGSLLAAGGAILGAASFLGGRPAYVAFNLLWSLLAGAGSPVLAAWIGELLPTRARAVSETCVALLGAVGGIAGLQLVARLQPALGLGHAIAWTAIAGVAGGLVLLLLPETRGRPLPE